MKPHRIGVRVSAELYTLLVAAGDVSAATRALAILGVQAAGYKLGALRDEAAGLLAEPLDAQLRAALRGLLAERPTPVPPVFDERSTPVPPESDTRSTPVEPMLNAPSVPPRLDLGHDDPLADVGIEV